MSKGKIGVLCLVPILVVGGIAYSYWSQRKATATATCEQIERFHSNLGVVNVPLYGLGKVLLLDPETKKAQGLLTVPVSDADKSPGSAAEDMTVKLETTFDVKFDVEVPEAVRGEAESTLKNLTKVQVKEVSRSELANPLEVANASESLKNQLKAIAEGNTWRAVMVSSLKKASSLEITLAEDVGGEARANVLDAGGYEVSVSYRCDGLLSLVGKETGVFFGVVPLRYDSASAAIVLDEKSTDVWEYDLSQTFGEGR